MIRGSSLIAIGIWVACALPPERVYAQTGGAIAGGVLAGTAAANASRQTARPPTELVGHELADWVDPRTAVTSRFGVGCGVIAELTLSGTAAKNFVNVTVQNESETTLAFMPEVSTVQFGSGRTRRLKSSLAGDIAIESHWWVHTALEFPDKHDFADQNSLAIALVFQSRDAAPCMVTTQFARDLTRAPDGNTSIEHTDAEIGLGAGPLVFASGGLKRLGAASGVTLDLDVSYFPWLHHGFASDFLIDGYGSDGVRRADPSFAGGPGAIAAFGFLVGYQARVFLLPWLSASYAIMSGPYGMSVNEGKDGDSKTSLVVFPLRQRLRFAARVARMGDGSAFMLTLSVMHVWVPYGQLGAVHASGTALAPVLSVMLGE